MVVTVSSPKICMFAGREIITELRSAGLQRVWCVTVITESKFSLSLNEIVTVIAI